MGRRRILPRLAALLIAVQACGSGLAAGAAAAGFDEARLLCGTLRLDAQARAAVVELAEATGLAPASGDPHADAAHDCPACAAAAVIVPAGPGPDRPVAYARPAGPAPTPLTGGPGLAGPPVGPRAPPVS